MPRKITDRTRIKIRKYRAGRYEWVRLCDNMVIMDAEKGVYEHDPPAWVITFYCYSPMMEGWVTNDNEVTYTLREAKDIAAGWAKSLIATNDLGYSTTREY